MTKKSFDGNDRGISVDKSDDIDAADLAGQIFENKDDQAEAEFGAKPWEFFKNDEVSFELNGVIMNGVVSLFRSVSSENSSIFGQYVMDILIKDPSSAAGRIPMLTCSLEDLKTDKYKILKIDRSKESEIQGGVVREVRDDKKEMDKKVVAAFNERGFKLNDKVEFEFTPGYFLPGTIIEFKYDPNSDSMYESEKYLVCIQKDDGRSIPPSKKIKVFFNLKAVTLGAVRKI